MKSHIIYRNPEVTVYTFHKLWEAILYSLCLDFIDPLRIDDSLSYIISYNWKKRIFSFFSYDINPTSTMVGDVVPQ